tara:strand:+ start:305 stop:787 length:483 start_codon:yes stop_codon:yes gene_type:complete
MSVDELRMELRQLRKEHLQGGNAVSKMKLADLRTEVAAIRRLNGNKERYPSLEGKTVGRPAARPMHNATVEDVDEDGEGIKTPVIPEKKVIPKLTQGSGKKSPEHLAKMQEALKASREAKKAAQGEKKEMKALVKEPEMPSKSERKTIHFCNCPDCGHRS